MQLELIIVLVFKFILDKLNSSTKLSNLPNLSVAEKIGIGLVLSDVENMDLGLHLSVEKAEKKKSNTAR
ncbi:hypothetical protein SADUNF_Sadunf08G0030200 [Salix dunnii]|uniref:Uncharacterized protein n=1 Tax=Salix dunnii TaxID=1413687 RepID=A0A835MT70_9ROSI|nr:hypothetical protein SADUNF_Sadunf08G0030200 [Salix dunnii]